MLFEQTLFQCQIGHAFFQRTSLAAQVLDFIPGGGTGRITGQAALVSVH